MTDHQKKQILKTLLEDQHFQDQADRQAIDLNGLHVICETLCVGTSNLPWKLQEWGLIAPSTQITATTGGLPLFFELTAEAQDLLCRDTCVLSRRPKWE